MTDINFLYKELLQQSKVLVSEIGKLEGDILILSVGSYSAIKYNRRDAEAQRNDELSRTLRLAVIY